MNEQTQSIPPTPPSTTGIDIGAIVSRAIGVLTNPQASWTQFKSEGKSISDIYLQYLVIIAALKPLSQFVQGTIVGTTNPITREVIRSGPVSGIILAIVGYGIFLGVAYIAALIIEKLAPNFGGSCSRSDAFALVAYSSTAACVGSGLGIIPLSIVGFIGALVSLYSIYLFYSGIETMTGVPAAKRLSFFAVYVIAMIFLMVAVGVVMMIFGFGFAML